MSIIRVYLLCLFVLSFCCVYLFCPFVVLILGVLLCLLLFRMPGKKGSAKAQQQAFAAQQQAIAAQQQATPSELQLATATEINRVAAVAASARDKMPAAEEQPPSSPTTSPAKSVAKSPAKSQGQSPGRLTKNSNKPTGGGSTVEDGGSMTEEGGSTLQATTAEASKKRKIDKSAADNVGSSSSQTGRVRREVDRLGNFSSQDHNSDEDGKSEVEDASDEDDDDEEDDIPSQPLTPSRSLELPIIKHLKKGRQIKSVSPLGDPHPDPNFP